MEVVLDGVGANALASRVDLRFLAGPVQSVAWWAGIFGMVWLAQGGGADPVRADIERRDRRRRELN